MILKTSGGEEISAVMITINERPKNFTFRIENMTVLETISVLSGDNVLPLQGYEEYTEIDCIRRSGRSDVMITLCPPEQERYAPVANKTEEAEESDDQSKSEE